jgi:hypothetical protein
MVSKTWMRVDASPVSRACQYGEFADSASSSGNHVRSPVATLTAASGDSIPTCTCSPKIATRSATQRNFSTTP